MGFAHRWQSRLSLLICNQEDDSPKCYRSLLLHLFMAFLKIASITRKPGKSLSFADIFPTAMSRGARKSKSEVAKSTFLRLHPWKAGRKPLARCLISGKENEEIFSKMQQPPPRKLGIKWGHHRRQFLRASIVHDSRFASSSVPDRYLLGSAFPKPCLWKNHRFLNSFLHKIPRSVTRTK